MVSTGRKATKVSLAGWAIATGFAFGNKSMDTAAGPMVGVEQIVQEWWDVCELSGCECTACAVPIANTNATHSTPRARVQKLLFGDSCVMRY